MTSHDESVKETGSVEETLRPNRVLRNPPSSSHGGKIPFVKKTPLLSFPPERKSLRLALEKEMDRLQVPVH